MARVKVTGYMDAEELHRFYDPEHEMGITEEFNLGMPSGDVSVYDEEGHGHTFSLEDLEFERVDD